VHRTHEKESSSSWLVPSPRGFDVLEGRGGKKRERRGRNFFRRAANKKRNFNNREPYIWLHCGGKELHERKGGVFKK